MRERSDGVLTLAMPFSLFYKIFFSTRPFSVELFGMSTMFNVFPRVLTFIILILMGGPNLISSQLPSQIGVSGNRKPPFCPNPIGLPGECSG